MFNLNIQSLHLHLGKKLKIWHPPHSYKKLTFLEFFSIFVSFSNLRLSFVIQSVKLNGGVCNRFLTNWSCIRFHISKLSQTIRVINDPCIIWFRLDQSFIWPGYFILMIVKSDVGSSSKKTGYTFHHQSSPPFNFTDCVTTFPFSLSRA